MSGRFRSCFRPNKAASAHRRIGFSVVPEIACWRHGSWSCWRVCFTSTCTWSLVDVLSKDGERNWVSYVFLVLSTLVLSKLSILRIHMLKRHTAFWLTIIESQSHLRCIYCHGRCLRNRVLWNLCLLLPMMTMKNHRASLRPVWQGIRIFNKSGNDRRAPIHRWLRLWMWATILTKETFITGLIISEVVFKRAGVNLCAL